MSLKDKNILLGVSGGIALYKACELVRILKKNGANIKVIMTRNATRFVNPLTFQTLSQNRVYIDVFESENYYDIEHISLTDWADVFVVAPATANVIGKFANGIADDLLSTTFLAFNKPILIVPAMNSNMYNNPILQQNINKLKDIGVNFIEPDSGLLACGVCGKGRYPENEKIKLEIEKLIAKKDLKGYKILITAGPTREYFDPVRFISNRSSGKMGYSLAEEGYKRGATVTIVSGPVNIKTYAEIEIVNVESALDMFEEVKKRFLHYDILIFSAAVADYRPKSYSSSKIKKESTDELIFELEKNPDILKFAGDNKLEHQIIVGFSAETSDLVKNSKKKLLEKGADLIVANDVLKEGAGFDVDTNIVTIISKDDTIELPILSKKEVSNRIYDYIVNYLCKK